MLWSIKGYYLNNRIVRYIICVSIALPLSLIIFGCFRFPWLVLYYIIIIKFNLIHLADFIPLAIIVWQVVVTSLCIVFISPIIFILSISKTITKNAHIYAIFITGILIIMYVALPPFLTLLPIEEEIKAFTISLKREISNSTELIKAVTEYVSRRIEYPRGHYKILELTDGLSYVDRCLLKILGFDDAHLILFQRYGSCGEYAHLTSYLLYRLCYEVRIAHFKDIDHGWCEVKLNNTWYIVDPWYIGHYAKSRLAPYLVPVRELSRISLFSSSKGVEAIYPNGTRVDASLEHGYKL